MADYTAVYQDVSEVLPQVQYMLGDNQWVDSNPTYDGAAHPLTDTYQDFEGLNFEKKPLTFGVLYPPR